MNPLRKLLVHKTEASLGGLALFALLTNVIDLAMHYWNFWESGRGVDPYPVPEQMMLLLWGSILVFAVPKEITRWTHPRGHRSRRSGQLFPILWGASLGAMVVIEWLTEGGYRVPQGMGSTFFGTFIIFLLSLSSKWAHRCRNGDEECADKAPPEEARTAG